VNAVLRAVQRDRGRALPPAVTSGASRPAQLDYLAVTLSHPRWLVDRWLDRYGFDRVVAAARFNNRPAPMTLRVNTLLAERASHARALEREAALAELSRRYFMSRGPATVQDFAKWSGLTTADARNGLEAVKAQLRHEVVDGQSYWFPSSMPSVKEVTPTAYLLSIYDEYISGYKDRSAIGEAEIGAKLIALGSALSYIIVVDGQIVGTWRRTLRKEAVVIETNLFTQLTKAENRAVAVAAQQYGTFLDRPVVLA